MPPFPRCGSRSRLFSWNVGRSEEHTSELQSRSDLVCRLLLEKKKSRDLSSATEMDFLGTLVGTTNRAEVAGDVRANEKIGLTSRHTVFACEDHRLVAAVHSSQ